MNTELNLEEQQELKAMRIDFDIAMRSITEVAKQLLELAEKYGLDYSDEESTLALLNKASKQHRADRDYTEQSISDMYFNN